MNKVRLSKINDTQVDIVLFNITYLDKLFNQKKAVLKNENNF